eukprot:1371799-Pleurochrysis_carterae.AAC.1
MAHSLPQICQFHGPMQRRHSFRSLHPTSIFPPLINVRDGRVSRTPRPALAKTRARSADNSRSRATGPFLRRDRQTTPLSTQPLRPARFSRMRAALVGLKASSSSAPAVLARVSFKVSRRSSLPQHRVGEKCLNTRMPSGVGCLMVWDASWCGIPHH